MFSTQLLWLVVWFGGIRAALLPLKAQPDEKGMLRRDVVTKSNNPVYVVTTTGTITQKLPFNPGVDVMRTSTVTSTTHLATTTVGISTSDCTTNSDLNTPPSWAISTETTNVIKYADETWLTLATPVTELPPTTWTSLETAWVTAEEPLAVTGTQCANTLVWLHVVDGTTTTTKTITNVGSYKHLTTSKVCMQTIRPELTQDIGGEGSGGDKKRAVAADPPTTTMHWTRTMTLTSTLDIPTSTRETTACDNPTFYKDIYRTRTMTEAFTSTVYVVGVSCTAGPEPPARITTAPPTGTAGAVVARLGEQRVAGRELDCGYTNKAGDVACYGEDARSAPGVYTWTVWVIRVYDTALEMTTMTVMSSTTICDLPISAPTATS